MNNINEKILKVVELAHAGKTNIQIAKELGISTVTVTKIRKTLKDQGVILPRSRMTYISNETIEKAKELNEKLSASS